MAFRPVSRTNDPKWKTSGGEPSSGESIAGFFHKGEERKPTGRNEVARDGFSIATVGYGIASGQDFERGDVVRLNGDGDVAEMDDITQTVRGVALEPVVSGAALGPVTDKCSVALAKYTDDNSGAVSKTNFATTDVNGTAPTEAIIGTQCALDLTAGAWTIDISDTSNTDVEIVDVLISRGEFLVVFLDADIQSSSGFSSGFSKGFH